MRRPWVRPVLLALTVIGGALAIAAAVQVAAGLGGFDAHTYWSTRLDTVYIGKVEGDQLPPLYMPPVIIGFAALGAVLSWPAFLLLWSLVEAGALTAMAGPLTPFILFLPPVATELRLGNIHAILGLAILLGFRWPATWSLVLLTKITPGVGLLWFAFRREWRSLAIALVVTAAIALPTLVLTPDLWRRWLEAMVANVTTGRELGSFVVPLWPRLIAAVIVVWIGARRGWRWMVPIAATLALPELWDHGLVILLACIPLAWPSLSIPALLRRPSARADATLGSPLAAEIAT